MDLQNEKGTHFKNVHSAGTYQTDIGALDEMIHYMCIPGSRIIRILVAVGKA